jgi:Ca-activated chloride channel family protein
MVAALFVFSSAMAGPSLPRTPGIGLEAGLNCPWMSTSGGVVLLHVACRGEEVFRRRHVPLNLAVVIDRSGSMGSEGKIENARMAVQTLIDQLAPDDLLSIVIYDDVVEVLRPAMRVGDKGDLCGLLEEITPRGWTNLGAGMLEGIRQVECHRSCGYLNRVILLSDGLANRGITDGEQLARLARRARMHSVSLSMIGVGLSYNENLMVALAGNGGGTYYYLECARDLASIFRREFDRISSVVAQNAMLELVALPGVHLKEVIGGEVLREGERITVALGDIGAGECREVICELDLSPGSGSRKIIEYALRYSSEGREMRIAEQSVSIRYTAEEASIDQHRNWDVQAKADVALSTRKVEDALHLLDAGSRDAAVEMLAAAQRGIASSPAAGRPGSPGAILQKQENRIGQYLETIRDRSEDRARAKKAIQYENYRVQRQR